MAPTKQATIPMDDPDLTDKEAMFQSLRQIIEKQDLLAARLDGLTEALGSIAADVKALASKPVAAAAAPTATRAAAPTTTAGGQRQTLGLIDLVPRTISSRDRR